MKFGKSDVLKTAKGKIGTGLALILFGLVAVLAAPNLTDKLICTLVVLAGGGMIAAGIRQDKTEKDKIRHHKEEVDK